METYKISDSFQGKSCHFNFAVPSVRTLQKVSSEYTLDAEKPGIMEKSLEVFSKFFNESDVKLSIDGKKISSGISGDPYRT